MFEVRMSAPGLARRAARSPIAACMTAPPASSRTRIAAAEAAIARGFAIECDVQLHGRRRGRRVPRLHARPADRPDTGLVARAQGRRARRRSPSAAHGGPDPDACGLPRPRSPGACRSSSRSRAVRRRHAADAAHGRGRDGLSRARRAQILRSRHRRRAAHARAASIPRGIVGENAYDDREWDDAVRAEQRHAMANLLHFDETAAGLPVLAGRRTCPAPRPSCAGMLRRMPVMTWTVRTRSDRRRAAAPRRPDGLRGLPCPEPAATLPTRGLPAAHGRQASLGHVGRLHRWFRCHRPRTDLRLRVAPALEADRSRAWDACANPDAGAASRPRVRPAVAPRRESTRAAADSTLEDDTDNPFVSHAFLSALEDSGCVGAAHRLAAGAYPGRGGRGRASSPPRPATLKSHSPGRVRLRPRLGRRLRARRRALLSEAAGRVPFTPGHRAAPAGLGRARAATPRARRSIAGPAGAARADRRLLGPRHLPARGRVGRARRGRASCSAPTSSSTGSTTATAASTISSARSPRASARRSGASGATRSANGITVEQPDRRATSPRRTGTPSSPSTWTPARANGAAPTSTARFFSLVGERMADGCCWSWPSAPGRYIAGAINFIGDDALYGRNWGCIEEHPFLHFEVCYYQAIDFAIAHGLDAGRGRRAGRAQARARLPPGHDLLGPRHRRPGAAPRRRRLSRRGSEPTWPRRRRSCPRPCPSGIDAHEPRAGIS